MRISNPVVGVNTVAGSIRLLLPREHEFAMDKSVRERKKR